MYICVYIIIHKIRLSRSLHLNHFQLFFQTSREVRSNLVIYNSCVSCVDAAWNWALQLLEDMEAKMRRLNVFFYGRKQW